ncbi:hypothetical protein LTS12_001545 [Elasticomyces elasticus]|nr:hypothetical protein LTS12_001545 [Elasticomyces elasticus]
MADKLPDHTNYRHNLCDPEVNDWRAEMRQAISDEISAAASVAETDHVKSGRSSPTDDHSNQRENTQPRTDQRPHKHVTPVENANLLQPLYRSEGVRPSDDENVDLDIMLEELDRKRLEELFVQAGIDQELGFTTLDIRSTSTYTLKGLVDAARVHDSANLENVLRLVYDDFIERVEYQVKYETHDVSHYATEAQALLDTDCHIKGDLGTERAVYVVKELKEKIQSIGYEALRDERPMDVSLGTKRSALIALKDIARAVLLAASPVGRKVREEMREENINIAFDELSGRMSTILEDFDTRQRTELADTLGTHGTFYEHIEYLVGIDKDLEVFPALHDILSMLNNTSEGDDCAGQRSWRGKAWLLMSAAKKDSLRLHR